MIMCFNNVHTSIHTKPLSHFEINQLTTILEIVNFSPRSFWLTNFFTLTLGICWVKNAFSPQPNDLRENLSWWARPSGIWSNQNKKNIGVSLSILQMYEKFTQINCNLRYARNLCLIFNQYIFYHLPMIIKKNNCCHC